MYYSFSNITITIEMLPLTQAFVGSLSARNVKLAFTGVMTPDATSSSDYTETQGLSGKQIIYLLPQLAWLPHSQDTTNDVINII